MTAPVLAAWGVHLYTAFGAVLGFLALEATANDRYGWAFLLMAVATFIDSTDGLCRLDLAVVEEAICQWQKAYR